MLARFLLGTVTAGAMIAPALAGMMTAEEARKFVAGKVFAFTCFDGTRGAGRILDDMGAVGAVQFNGSGPIRHLRLPGNTLQIRGQAVCASLRGMPAIRWAVVDHPVASLMQDELRERAIEAALQAPGVLLGA